ncbi:MAG: hypothetical protein J4G18_00905 [Anaerolineae bacterium]|nr:hypothetical protein [Anaerolineae bacterium]
MLDLAKEKFQTAKRVLRSHPYISLTLFVVIVLVIAALGFLRYQHVQAEIAAQQNLLNRIQSGFDHWTDDLSMRFGILKESLQGTAQGATNVVGGVWGIISYLVTAVFDFIGNLHIMIPVTIIYFGVGFFGTLIMRVVTLIGALIAFFLSISLGIVQWSVIGLLAIAGLLFWNKIDTRLLTKIQDLPARLKARFRPQSIVPNEDLADESERKERLEEAPQKAQYSE